MSDTLTIIAKWQSQSQTLQVSRDSTVAQLTEILKDAFGMETCKMVGLVKGKLPEPDTRLSTLHQPGASVKLMLIGTVRGALDAMGEQESLYAARKLIEDEQRARDDRMRAEQVERDRKRREEYEAMEAIRRQEYEEKRRIDLAAYEERRRVQEAEARERELREEQSSNNGFTTELQAFHLPALDATQKLLLPPHILQEIINSKIQFPLTFQVLKPESFDAVQAESAAASTAATAAAASSSSAAARSSSEEETKMDTSPSPPPDSSFSLTAASSSLISASSSPPFIPPIVSPLVSYYAVQDFTAPNATVSVPLSLLKSLHMEDGAKLRLTTVRLRKAESITLRPLRAAWSKLPELERRALLEFQLRKSTFLVQDSVLSFTYHPHLPSFEFRVVETKPDPVVSITDTNVATDILPFDDGSTTMSDENAPAASSSSISTPKKDETKIVPDEVMTGKLIGNSSTILTYEVTDPNLSVTIDVTSVRGDIDLYVLNSSSDSPVDIANFTWCVQTKGNKTLKLSAADPQFQTGVWQVMLRAYGADGEYSLVVKEAQGASSSSGGHSLASTTAATTSTSSSSPPPDHTLCPNCKSYISAKSFSMHSLQCARINYCCNLCGVVMKTNEKQKHHDLVHAKYTCLCGVQLDQPNMIAHKRDTCSLRLVPCQYCPLRLVVAERGAHQADCGTMTSQCPLCAKSFQRKVMRRHLVREHGGINGKTDERDLTYADFWSS